MKTLRAHLSNAKEERSKGWDLPRLTPPGTQPHLVVFPILLCLPHQLKAVIAKAKKITWEETWVDVGGKTPTEASSTSFPESLRQFRPGVSLPKGWAALGSHPKLLTLLESLFAFRDDPLVRGAKEN